MPLMMADLGRVLGATEPPARCVELIAEIASLTSDEDARWQPTALTGIAEGVRGRVKGTKSPLMNLLAGNSPAAVDARKKLDGVIARSSSIVQDAKQPLPARLAAISLLGQASYETSGPRAAGRDRHE